MKAKILLSCIIFIFTSCNFAPGSFPYAEIYKIPYEEKEVIVAVNKFLEKNPRYQVSGSIQKFNGRESEDDHWYNFYFYCPEVDELFLTWTRPSGKKSTSFAFVSVSNGKTLGKWRRVNHDLDELENKKRIDLFEKNILGKIKEEIK